MMRILTGGFLALSLLGLGACETSQTPLQAQAAALDAQLDPVNALPPQRLRTGQCGLFLFERRAPQNFVVFENETTREVQLVYEGVIVSLRVSPQPAVFAPGEAFRRVYLDADAHRTFTLSGEVGIQTSAGPRLENVLLEIRDLDGSRTVRPLAGVRSCEDG